MGCLFLLFGLFAAGSLVVGIWAAAAILGLVEAPPVVTAAGIVAFLVVAIGGVAAARAFRRLTAPLDELIAAAARIEAGDLSARVPAGGPREMRSLARAFNDMSDRLEDQERRRRTFLADVTHELRTPLTVLQGQLEAIDEGIYAADEARIRGLLGQTQLMAGLVEDLHTIALAEARGLRLELVEADLDELAEELLTSYATSADVAGLSLRLEHPARPVHVSLDRAATRRILGNLITNALRHCPAGSTITIAVRRDAAGAIVEVSDDGPGMPPELASRAFDRFEKGATSDGSGLGLAIARDLAEAQGCTIVLHSTLGVGTTVALTWPRAADAASG